MVQDLRCAYKLKLMLPCCSLSVSIEPGDYNAVNEVLRFLSGTARDGPGS